ncbi:LiaI-LiaF-like domain-containing protein [Burkholderia sp. LMU1-1-1.1]|jgi:predicted membrane protein|uniref:LiaI-LiaF-like domain-containing protein n=1 Tax=Burkholderia sp. LMU1-1-1.1 TaxID=3135266 RepID=UPI003416AB0E
MSSFAKTDPKSQMAIGVAVIVIGLLFLVDNLGWIDLDFRRHLLPLALIFFGALKLMQTRTSSGRLIGGGLIAGGCVIFLRRFGIFDISWQSLWPVMLIVFGIAVVLKSGTGSSGFKQASAKVDNEFDQMEVDITSFMGAFKRRIITADFRGGEITALMGGCDLDLRQSSINGEAVLNVFSLFGGVTIKVPVDWTVVLQGTPIMGGFEEKTVPPATPGKVLYVRGYAIMGGLEVRN